MEDLPAEMAFQILSKLAVQDPLSLLRALFASTFLFCVAEENPVLWLKALFGLEPGTDLPTLHGRCQTLCATFAVDMVSLGLCKQLVVARLAKLIRGSKGSGCEQIQEMQAGIVANGFVEETQILKQPSEAVRYLYLVRLQGRLLLWRVYWRRPGNAGDYALSIINFFNEPFRRVAFPVFRGELHPVYADVTYTQIHEAWVKAVGSPDPRSTNDLYRAPVTLEIHRILKDGESLNGYRVLSSEVFEYDYQAFLAWGYLSFNVLPTSKISAVPSNVRTPCVTPSQGEPFVRKARRVLHAMWWFLGFGVVVLLLRIVSYVALAVVVFLALSLYGLFFMVSRAST